MNTTKNYISRNLQLICVESWCHDPCMVDGEWYWSLSITFGIWVYRAISNAKLNNALTPDMLAKYDVVRMALRDAYGDACDAIPAAAKNPAHLAPIPPEWFSGLFRSHMGLHASPPWPNYEQDELRWGPKELASPDVADEKPTPAAAVEPIRANRTPYPRQEPPVRPVLFVS